MRRPVLPRNEACRGLPADWPRAEPHTEVDRPWRTTLRTSVSMSTRTRSPSLCSVPASSSPTLVACYEAGPTGYGTQRLLASLNVACDVIAPSLVPKRSGDRVKTDRLDARNLARLHRAGELTPIRIPSSEEEALRDLVRLREDLKDDRRRMQHRIKSFLLRHDRRCPDHRRGWSRRYRLWVSSQRFDDPNTQLAFDHLLAALNTRTVQLDDIDRQLGVAAAHPPLGDDVARLRTFRGLDTLSA